MRRRSAKNRRLTDTPGVSHTYRKPTGLPTFLIDETVAVDEEVSQRLEVHVLREQLH